MKTVLMWTTAVLALGLSLADGRVQKSSLIVTPDGWKSTANLSNTIMGQNGSKLIGFNQSSPSAVSAAAGAAGGRSGSGSGPGEHKCQQDSNEVKRNGVIGFDRIPVVDLNGTVRLLSEDIFPVSTVNGDIIFTTAKALEAVPNNTDAESLFYGKAPITPTTPTSNASNGSLPANNGSYSDNNRVKDQDPARSTPISNDSNKNSSNMNGNMPNTTTPTTTLPRPTTPTNYAPRMGPVLPAVDGMRPESSGSAPSSDRMGPVGGPGSSLPSSSSSSDQQPAAALPRTSTNDPALSRPSTPGAANSRPISPDAAMSRPISPDAAMSRPISPDVANGRPINPSPMTDAATSGPMTPSPMDDEDLKNIGEIIMNEVLNPILSSSSLLTPTGQDPRSATAPLDPSGLGSPPSAPSRSGPAPTDLILIPIETSPVFEADLIIELEEEPEHDKYGSGPLPSSIPIRSSPSSPVASGPPPPSSSGGPSSPSSGGPSSSPSSGGPSSSPSSGPSSGTDRGQNRPAISIPNRPEQDNSNSLGGAPVPARASMTPAPSTPTGSWRELILPGPRTDGPMQPARGRPGPPMPATAGGRAGPRPVSGLSSNDYIPVGIASPEQMKIQEQRSSSIPTGDQIIPNDPVIVFRERDPARPAPMITDNDIEDKECSI